MRFIITGGKRLSGEVEVRGAKNSALKAFAASLLFENPITVKNVPDIEDVSRMRELLEALGVSVTPLVRRMVKIDAHGLSGNKLKKDIAEQFRGSIVLAGPLLARTGSVLFPHPGGCVIGKRPIDLFLKGWRAFGANIEETKSGYELTAKKLKGADITFRVVSVTGTEALMMTAVLAEGKTLLRNAACEPEIPSLAEFLNRSGAKITGAGTSTIEIIGTGGKMLKARRPFEVIPDRIEAGTFLILGAALGKSVKIKNCNPEHLSALIAALRDAGAKIDIGPRSLVVRRPKQLFARSITTREYPGFMTDLQAPFTVLMTQAHGESLVFETIFEGRLNYVEELNRMGAHIVTADPHRVFVHGPTPLHGRDVASPDLRAGLAFVIAGLIARGESVIRNVYQIDRGYEHIETRLQKLGADIRREK